MAAARPRRAYPFSMLHELRGDFSGPSWGDFDVLVGAVCERFGGLGWFEGGWGASLGGRGL